MLGKGAVAVAALGAGTPSETRRGVLHKGDLAVYRNDTAKGADLLLTAGNGGHQQNAVAGNTQSSNT